MIPATLISTRYHTVAGKLSVGEHFFNVPLDHSIPDGESIKLFARSAVRPREGPAEPDWNERPWLVFLQGGPGMGCPAPQDANWVNAFLDKGYKILLLDQRGTGLSSPITTATLDLRGDVKEQAKYLKLFRADNIVRDCEAIRLHLTKDCKDGYKKWAILGQSFGGFCAVTYLSFHPEGLREVFITGGVPPLRKSPDDVYKSTYEKVESRNLMYYTKYPEDVDRVKKIINYLEGDLRMVHGGATIVAPRFLRLGINFGMRGGLDYVHDVVLRASNDIDTVGFITQPTLIKIADATSFDGNMLYAVLHEAIYCQGQASNWCAERLLRDRPQFNFEDNDGPVYFTGEMVYQEVFNSSAEMVGVKKVAEIIARNTDWPDLYDEEQLARNEVPVCAAIFVDDMYVHYNLAIETAAKIRNCKTFITNMMHHNAIRVNSEELFKQLFILRDDVID